MFSLGKIGRAERRIDFRSAQEKRPKIHPRPLSKLQAARSLRRQSSRATNEYGTACLGASYPQYGEPGILPQLSVEKRKGLPGDCLLAHEGTPCQDYGSRE